MIRVLDHGDASAFRALRLRGLEQCPVAFSSSYEEECNLPLEFIAERLRPRPQGVTFGAVSDDVLIGLVGLVRESKAKLSHKAFLWGMYVDVEHRQRGVGRALLTSALNRAQDMPGVRQVSLSVTATNTPALRLYQSFGFVEFGREPAAMWVDGAFQDEISMVRVL